MSTVVAPTCPRCKRAIELSSLQDPTTGTCRCDLEYEFVPFPALTAGRARVTAQTAVLEAESVCFFHAENRAESVCEECGRFLCPVCTLPFAGRKLCPMCVSAASRSNADGTAGTTTEVTAIRSRVLWSSIALAVAVVPLLFFFVTIVTAPVALGLVGYAWNKPGSLVAGRHRWRLIVATLFALAEIAGWVAFFLPAFTKALNG